MIGGRAGSSDLPVRTLVLSWLRCCPDRRSTADQLATEQIRLPIRVPSGPCKQVEASRRQSASNHTTRGAPTAKPERTDNLCDLVVFVQDASRSVASSDAELLQIDHVVRQWACRCGLAKSAVGPVA